MITGELKSQVDKLWESFWSGGVANPLTVIEQITYLLFIRRLDEIQQLEEKKANIAGIPMQRVLFTDAQQNLRWSNFKNKDPESMFDLFTRAQAGSLTVFEHMKEVGGNSGGVFAQYMKGATFMIPTARLLDQVVQMIDKIQMDDRDTKGDLYEYLLSKIATAGTNGQFRTPRHIIKMMVDMVEPNKEDVICDPSCGTAGFLVAAGEYFHENHKDYFLDKDFRAHYNGRMFNGVEFDATMLRIGAMNLNLHGIENPNLIGKDALSESNANIRDSYTLILANPPFKGSLDYDSVEKSILQKVKTKKTELLFLGLMLRMLKTGGRCAVIVPDGVLFGSSKAHKQIREEILAHHRLEAVISMPSGVFKPYAGVSTAILFFTKTGTGGTDNVWFYDMKADGFSLDDKRTPLDKAYRGDSALEVSLDEQAKTSEVKHENNNIPDIIKRWRSLKSPQEGGTKEGSEADRPRTAQSFLVPFSEIKTNDWDLSINRYKEIEYEEVQYDAPKDIIGAIRELQKENQQDLDALERMIKE
ncbi:MAG: class I SAM-dependent DNA methyltransferase [Cyclobacteriaceae bacterium]